jgi:hypothetical protein
VFHFDATVAQRLPLGKLGAIGLGANAFYYRQFTGDSGSGAVLGDFEGRTIGVGPVLSYITKLGKTDLAVEVKWLPEHDGPSVSETLLQSLLSYTFKSLTTIGVVSEATYDWQARQWTVPVNLTVSQLFQIGKFPLKLTLGGRLYAERPPGGPDWGLCFTMTFLVPK